MAIRKILNEKYDNAALRRKSREVEKIDDRIITLLEDMEDTLRKAEGVGLAAPQIGVLRRVVIVDIGEGKYEMINPVITKSDGEDNAPEGCLSVPGFNGYVKRPYSLTVKYRDRNFEEKILEAEDFLARAICHELDHLDGILYIDKATDIYEVD